MVKRGEKKKSKKSSKQDESFGDGGSGDKVPPDDPMPVEENQPALPFFTYNKNEEFESYNSATKTDRRAPFKIHHGVHRIIVHSTNADKKVLYVSRYGDRLADVLGCLRQDTGRYVSSACRELIKGIVKEFCHQMEVNPEQPMYLHHLENYLLTGFEPYKVSRASKNSDLDRIRKSDEFSARIQVKFVNSVRSGPKQKTVLSKLNALKNVLRRLYDDPTDEEWMDFLSKLSVSTYQNAVKHFFLWHWDKKLRFIWYIYHQLYLNGIKIADYAKHIFDDVPFVEENWEIKLLQDHPPSQVYKTRVKVIRPGVEEEEDADFIESTNVGTNTSTHASTSTSTSTRARTSLQASVSIHKINRQKRGRKLIKVIRNLGWHLTETQWDPVDRCMKFVHIRDGEPTDNLYSSRVHLYRLVKLVFPTFWITFVPILRSAGFRKY